jgi:hypothetical protein
MTVRGKGKEHIILYTPRKNVVKTGVLVCGGYRVHCRLFQRCAVYVEDYETDKHEPVQPTPQQSYH